MALVNQQIGFSQIVNTSLAQLAIRGLPLLAPLAELGVGSAATTSVVKCWSTVQGTPFAHVLQQYLFLLISLSVHLHPGLGHGVAPGIFCVTGVTVGTATKSEKDTEHFAVGSAAIPLVKMYRM